MIGRKIRKRKKLVVGLLLVFLLVSLVVLPVAEAKKSGGGGKGKKDVDSITFVRLKDINFVSTVPLDKDTKKFYTKTKLKDLLKVEWGYGKYTNATIYYDGKRLTIYLEDNEKHDGRWFALSAQVLEKLGINPSMVNVKLDTKTPVEVVKRLKADGKWFYFYIDHFTVRYVTFEASEGYVEYSDWGWQNYTKLIEPDPYCEDCAVFAPLDDLTDNGDGTGSTTIYVNEVQGVATVINQDNIILVSGHINNAFKFIDESAVKYTFATTINTTMLSYTTIIVLNSSDISDGAPHIIGVGKPYYTMFTTHSGKLRLLIGNGDWKDILDTSFTLQADKEYLVGFNIDTVNKTAEIFAYDGQTLQKESFTITSDWVYLDRWGLGSGLAYTTVAEYQFHGVQDEVRLYINKTITTNEIKLFFSLGHYKLPLWQGNEADLPAYLNATLFCPLDELDTANNVTPCYLNKEEVNATVYFNETAGYPKLVSGKVLNALEFGGNGSTDMKGYVEVTTDVLQTASKFTIVAFFKADPNITPESNEWIVDGYYYDRSIYMNIYGQVIGYLVLDSGEVSVASKNNYRDGQWHMIVFMWDNETGIMRLVIDDFKEDITKTGVHGSYVYTSTSISIGANNGGTKGFGGTIDEVRIYVNKTLTDNEIKLLYHLSRHKTAQLSAPSASFDGSQFLVNVTASLPNDGKSYILPAPIGAQASYSSVGTIGNFTFLDVGTAGSANFVVPVPSDLTPPAGVNLLVWLYNDELYITGQADQFPLLATVMNLPKGVWYVPEGAVHINQITENYTKLIVANVTESAVVKRYPDLFVNPTVNYVNVTVLEKSRLKVSMNVSAELGEEVVFTVGGLIPDHKYRLYVDGNETDVIETSKSGYLSFTWDDWSTHLITLEAYSPGEEWFVDTVELVKVILGAIAFIPIFGFAYVLYLMYSTMMQQRMYGREAVPNEVFEAITRFGTLLFIVGIIAVMFVIVAVALLQIL